MMFRPSRQHRQFFRQILMLLVIPLVLTGTGYALFTQQLSVNTVSDHIAYSASQNLLVTYQKSSAPSGQSLVYTINPMTVKNNGAAATESWAVTFVLPAGFSQLACTNATCTQNGTTITAVNTTGNAVIAPGSTITFSFTFRTDVANYTLQNMTVAGTFAPVFQTMSGLTVSATAGTRTRSGKWYYWPYTFTVTNNSGQNISAWRIVAPWNSTTNSVQTMPATVNYVAGATQLTITSKTGMNTGTNFQFTPSLGSTSINWVLSGYTIQGAL